MEFQRLCCLRLHLRKSIAMPSWLVLYGALGMGACSTPPPDLSQRTLTAFGNYLSEPYFKAFVVDFETDAYAWQSRVRGPSLAIASATQRCEKHGSTCEVFAVGNRVVVGMTDEQIATIKEEYLARNVTAPEIDDRGYILSSEEIKKYFSGKTLTATANTGDQFTVTFFSNGKISARMIGAEIKDTGTWYVEDNKYCRKFMKFTLGKLDCMQIVKDGNIFRFYSEEKYVGEYFIE